MALVTAIGASVDSHFFYARTKGELERDVKAVGFESLTIVRPFIIGGQRNGAPSGRGHCATAIAFPGSDSAETIPHKSRCQCCKRARGCR
jgi:uncharacterized protein YbjT (DUF2867 family)